MNQYNYTRGTLRPPTNLGPLYPQPKNSSTTGILIFAVLAAGSLALWKLL